MIPDPNLLKMIMKNKTEISFDSDGSIFIDLLPVLVIIPIIIFIIAYVFKFGF